VLNTDNLLGLKRASDCSPGCTRRVCVLKDADSISIACFLFHSCLCVFCNIGLQSESIYFYFFIALLHDECGSCKASVFCLGSRCVFEAVTFDGGFGFVSVDKTNLSCASVSRKEGKFLPAMGAACRNGCGVGTLS